MIAANNITKQYDTLQVLKGVNLSVQTGEIVSIVGKSGAGKTTLLQILGTLDRPTGGTLALAGQDTTKLSEKELSHFRNKNIGFVFQFHHLLPEFTALENVCLPGFIAKTPKSQIEKRAKELLDMLGLADRASHKPSTMSGGEQQRVSVARALINSPGVIFADEPSGNLDTQNAQELHQLFFDLRKEFNQTFVIVTHNNELADMADRKIILADGMVAGK